jgi:hypothetical protein
MTDVISSRTPEGEPFRCPICGLVDRIEASRPPGDAPCPSCGHLIWPIAIEPATRGSRRSLVKHAEALLRKRSRRPMLGLVATVARQVRRVLNARPRWEPRETPVWKSGVYDHWLDG